MNALTSNGYVPGVYGRLRLVCLPGPNERFLVPADRGPSV